jgi:indolepyruvate ferredoxin oxidoreductase alpha subunit
MSYLTDTTEGVQHLLMGNEAIARGALEAGISVASGYPGTPSSEIIENLSRVAARQNIYVEWSTNEKVALEVSAAASFAGLRALCAMKQNGVNVASDFLLHLASSGTRGGIVLVPCDDPGALSSVNEGESRYFARLLEVPLLEPADFQEAKDVVKWAFELSETIKNVVMVRSVTRLSHASGNVIFGALPVLKRAPAFEYHGHLLDPDHGPVISLLPGVPESKHAPQQEKLKKAAQMFEHSPFNTYEGPENPELLIVTCSVASLYSKEAVHILKLKNKVGILKIGTTWPLPLQLLKKFLSRAKQVLFVEEVFPFLEEQVKILAADCASEIGVKVFWGKHSRHIPSVGELNPDLIIGALSKLLGLKYQAVTKSLARKVESATKTCVAPHRELSFCPGCPHRASYWSIHNALELDGRKGFVCGDIGCYTLGMLACGFSTIKTVHSMGSGTGIASGFGKLKPFGLDQPVVAVCGDSTFFHAAIPALINAIHHQSPFTLVILDNRGTAMTGFQSHPGLPVNAMGENVPALEIAEICQAMGASVEIRDPFDVEETQKTLNRLLETKNGLNVLILRQACALSPERKAERKLEMQVNETICVGENCGCNRLCTRIFRCPGLIWDREKATARIDEVMCVGCGVCSFICPSGAITRKDTV